MLKQFHVSDLKFLMVPLRPVDMFWWWSVRFDTNPEPRQEQTILVVFWSKMTR